MHIIICQPTTSSLLAYARARAPGISHSCGGACVRVSDPNPARPPAHPNALPVRRHFVRPPLLCQQSDIICQHRWKFAGMAVWCGNGELHKFAMTLDFAGTNQQTPPPPTFRPMPSAGARAPAICRRGRRRSRRRSLSLFLSFSAGSKSARHPAQLIRNNTLDVKINTPSARAAVWRRRRPPDTPEHVRTCQRPYHNNRKPPPPPPRTSESIRLMRPGFE